MKKTLLLITALALLLASCEKKSAPQAQPPAHPAASETKTFIGRIHNYTMWGPPGYGAKCDTDPILDVLLFMPDNRSKSMVLEFADAKESEWLHEWDKVRVSGVPYEIQTAT